MNEALDELFAAHWSDIAAKTAAARDSRDSFVAHLTDPGHRHMLRCSRNANITHPPPTTLTSLVTEVELLDCYWCDLPDNHPARRP